MNMPDVKGQLPVKPMPRMTLNHTSLINHAGIERKCRQSVV